MIDDGHHHRTRRAIEEAVDAIVEHWPGSLTPPPQPGAQSRAKPSSKPPMPVSALNARESAWRDLRSWAQLVMEERDLTLGPRSTTGPDIALFLARHADWLSRHEAGRDCAAELAGHAGRLRDLATGSYTKRFPVGACPEQVTDEDGALVLDADGLTQNCPGQLFALMRREDAVESLLPRMVTCDTNRGHVWEPSQWHALGRRLGHIDYSAGRSFLRVVHSTG